MSGMRCGGRLSYCAVKIYPEAVKGGKPGWPVNVLANDPDPHKIETALKEGPYGRCVYACDNNVVDHQVVNMQFEGGASAALTAFTPSEGRHTAIFGTRGMIKGDGSVLKVFGFLTDKETVIDTNAGDAGLLGRHGGGDGELMTAFVKAVAENDASCISSGLQETLESHLMVFQTEASRHKGSVEKL